MKKLLVIVTLLFLGLSTAVVNAQTAAPAAKPATQASHVKKDGTVDKRFKANKTAAPATAPAATPAATAAKPSMMDKAKAAMAAAKAKMTPAAKTATAPTTSTAAAAPAAPAKKAEAKAKGSVSPTGVHLKKDGTPDMRYKENKEAAKAKKG